MVWVPSKIALNNVVPHSQLCGMGSKGSQVLSTDKIILMGPESIKYCCNTVEQEI